MNCVYCTAPIDKHWFHIAITTSGEETLLEDKVCQACGIRAHMYLIEFKHNNPRRTFITAKQPK